MGNRPVTGDEAEQFLTAANLNGLPPIFYEEPDGLNRRSASLVGRFRI